MRRFRLLSVFIGGAVLVCLSPPIAGQVQEHSHAHEHGKEAASTCSIVGADRLRLIVRQVELDFEQRRHVRGLIEVYEAEYQRDMATLEERLELVRAVFEDLQAVESVPPTLRDPKREAEVRERLRLLAPGARAEDELFAQLEKMLQPGQRDQLAKAHRSPLPTTAEPLDLTAEQIKELTALDRQVRSQKGDQPGEDRWFERVADKVRRILKGEQVKRFDEKFAAMRPKTPGVGVLAPPATQPAGTDASKGP
jgi:chorismate mutase